MRAIQGTVHGNGKINLIDCAYQTELEMLNLPACMTFVFQRLNVLQIENIFKNLLNMSSLNEV